MGGVVKSVAKVFGIGEDGTAQAMQRQADQQRQQYEAQLKQQQESAKLSSANMNDNLTNVQTGDSLAATDGLTSAKKKKQTSGVSSALGVA